jgi:hypothetical protein
VSQEIWKAARCGRHLSGSLDGKEVVMVSTRVTKRVPENVGARFAGMAAARPSVAHGYQLSRT